MIRLHIVVEGKTEKEFVEQVLMPAFSPLGIIADARCVATSRKGGRKHKFSSIEKASHESYCCFTSRGRVR
jgi:hypothetical protein